MTVPLTPATRTIKFFVPGKSAPQGSKRHVGGGRMIESSADLGPWRERVALVAAQCMSEMASVHSRISVDVGMFDRAVSVRLDFVLPRPKSTPKRSTPQAIKRPDIDKLARACLDALTNVVITDDSLVVELVARKRLAQPDEMPGVGIKVSSGVEVTR